MLIFELIFTRTRFYGIGTFTVSFLEFIVSQHDEVTACGNIMPMTSRRSQVSAKIRVFNSRLYLPPNRCQEEFILQTRFSFATEKRRSS